MEAFQIFNIVLLITIIIGIVLVIISFIRLSHKNDNVDNSSRYLEVDNTIKALDLSISEADKAVEELNKFSATILDEMNNKYQELLFIYNLIDEKKKELALLYNITPQNNYVDTDIIVNDNIKPSYSNPKLKEIMELHNKGLSVSEISQKLNLGQGEVKLILGLGKQR